MNLEVILRAGLSTGTILIFATIGEIITERSGVMNLGVEGIDVDWCDGCLQGLACDAECLVGFGRRHPGGGRVEPCAWDWSPFTFKQIKQ